MDNLHELYRKARAEGTRAAQALSGARYKLKMRDVKLPGYAGDSVRIDLPRGEYITLRLEHDSDADIEERLQCQFEPLSHGEQHEHARIGWIDREGHVYADGTPTSARFTPGWWSDGYGFEQFWENGKRQHSRHDAWLRARELVRKAYDYYNTIMTAGYVGYVATLHAANGEELDEDSCWGFEADGDYAAEEGWYAAKHMAEQRARHWVKEVQAAREGARRQRQQFHNLAADLREFRAEVSGASRYPYLHEALCDTLRFARASHRTYMQQVIG